MKSALDILLDRGRTLGKFKLELFDVTKNGIVAPTPHEVQEFANLMTNTGAALCEDLLIGAGGTTFVAANAYVGVGDSSTAVSAAHTNLQAATNKLRNLVSSASRSGQVLSFIATFATGDANWTWNEMGVFNHASAGTMLCRALVASPFTKTSALSIVATYTWQVS